MKTSKSFLEKLIFNLLVLIDECTPRKNSSYSITLPSFFYPF